MLCLHFSFLQCSLLFEGHLLSILLLSLIHREPVRVVKIHIKSKFHFFFHLGLFCLCNMILKRKF